jgi:hypothetical protein
MISKYAHFIPKLIETFLRDVEDLFERFVEENKKK